MVRESHEKTLRLVMLATLTALVIILQLIGTFLPKLGVTMPSLVLIPIVLGAILYGPGAGAWLGFVFGAVVVIGGVSGLDGFTQILFQDHPILTVLLCLGKGLLAGLVCALVYRVLCDKNEYLALFAAAATAPIVNTGLFILGSYTMMDTFQSNFLGGGTSMFYFLVIVCAGWNFIFELLLNLLLCPALSRVIGVIKPQKGN